MVRQSGLTLTAYVTELVAVPHTELILLVPRTTAGGVVSGRPISSAGSWIRPPPPTTASTQPAASAASTRNARLGAGSCPSSVKSPGRRGVHGGHDVAQGAI